MANLRDTLKNTHAAALFNTQHFGEDVVYKPKAGGSSTIRAVLRRRELESSPESNRIARRTIRVWIRNHATLGITKPLEGDKIALKVRPSDASTEDMRVNAILSSNEALHQLEMTA